MLVCTKAAVLPTVAVTAPMTPTTAAIAFIRGLGAKPEASDSAMNTRRISTRAAPLLATERKALTSMLAPSNTSGHQKWNGTAEILNPIAQISQNTATTSSAVPPAAGPTASAT